MRQLKTTVTLALILWRRWILPRLSSQKNLNYQALLAEYVLKHGKALAPVNVRNPKNRVPETTRCPHCDAPHIYFT